MTAVVDFTIVPSITNLPLDPRPHSAPPQSLNGPDPGTAAESTQACQGSQFSFSLTWPVVLISVSDLCSISIPPGRSYPILEPRKELSFLPHAMPKYCAMRGTSAMHL